MAPLEIIVYPEKQLTGLFYNTLSCYIETAFG